MTLLNPLATLSNTPSLLLDSRCALGESPRWNSQDGCLYWVDIDAQRLHRWNPRTLLTETKIFDVPVACFAFRAGGGLLLGMRDGCGVIDDWADTPRPIGEQPLKGRKNHRMNDGRTDPAGRFWVGSVDSDKRDRDAALYRLDGAALTEIEGGMLTCNGAAFTGDGRRFAHSDTPSHTVRVYDADPDHGTLSNRRILHQFDNRTNNGVGPGLGRPDGGSFDENGDYWVAMFDGWRVVRLSSDGDILTDLRLPVQRPTMIAFGGADRRIAFVTSARTGLSTADLAAQPSAGGIFAFRVDIPGVPEFSAQL